MQALLYRGLKPPGASQWSPPGRYWNVPCHKWPEERDNRCLFRAYGHPSDFRAGANFFPWKNQVVSSPVGAQSLPYDVGSNGPVLHSSFIMWFWRLESPASTGKGNQAVRQARCG